MTNPPTVLVTGASGRQGGALARLLLASGRHVRALTRKPDSAAASELQRRGLSWPSTSLTSVSSPVRPDRSATDSWADLDDSNTSEEAPATSTKLKWRTRS